MKIDAYEFGRIDIGGKRYDSDVIVSPETVKDHWWRQQGHRLAVEDLSAVIDVRPEVLVIGTGFYGNMVVPDETKGYLVAKGLDVRVSKTGDAVREFNRLQRDCARVVAALHLTC